MNDCFDCVILENENDRLLDRLERMRDLALEALAGQESWVKDQLEGTDMFDDNMAEIVELRNLINRT